MGGAMEGKAGSGLGWAGPKLWSGEVERELGLGQEGSGTYRGGVRFGR